jgi:hypothetical protein
MASLYRSALALGLLAVVSAPVAAFAHDDDNQVYSSSSSSARVIQYDPNSSEDIYETYDNDGQANQQYYSHRWGNDREEGEYRSNNGDNGRHRGRHRRNKRNRHRSNDSNYTYNRFGQPVGGVYNRQSTDQNRPQIIYRPSTTQQGTNCVNSRFGRVCT